MIIETFPAMPADRRRWGSILELAEFDTRNAWTLRRQRLPIGAVEITLRGDRGFPVFAAGSPLPNPTDVAILVSKMGSPEVTHGGFQRPRTLICLRSASLPRVRPAIESP